jgi:hypothetical protein
MWLFIACRLADFLGGALDDLRLPARVERLAHAVSILSSIIFSSVMTLVLLPSSNHGDGGLRIGPRRNQARAMDHCHGDLGATFLSNCCT